MKKLIVLLVLLFFYTSISAQKYNNVKVFEFELGVGGNLSNTTSAYKSAIGFQAYAETRLNIPGTGFDMGFQFDLAAMRGIIEGSTQNAKITCTPLTTFYDYSYRGWKNVALFGGLGLGVARSMSKYLYDDMSTWDSVVFSYTLNPRIGVELFNHLRVTFEYSISTDPVNTYCSLTIGGVIGGGYKRK